MLYAIGASAKGTRQSKILKQNEDSFLVSPGQYLVADGLGSTDDPDIASRTAIRAMSHGLEHALPTGSKEIIRLLGEANQQVYVRSWGSMSTIVGAWFPDLGGSNAEFLGVSVGDSRAYLLGSTTESLRQLTVDDATIRPDDGGPRRSITAALGCQQTLLGPSPLFQGSLGRGECLILCTDGFWEGFEESPSLLEYVLLLLKDPAHRERRLVSAVREAAAITTDDATAVLVLREENETRSIA